MVKSQPEVTVTNSIKPHSSTICLEPLISGNARPESLNTCAVRLDPRSSSMLHPDPACTGSRGVQPSSQSSSYCLNSINTGAQSVNPFSLYQRPVEPGGANPEPQNNQEVLSHTKPFNFVSACDASVGQVSRSSIASRVQDALSYENGNQVVVPLPDPPPNSCLKSGTLTNHKDPRSSSRVGLRVHFKLPEDEEESDASCPSEDAAQTSTKEPPPVRAKPKLWVKPALSAIRTVQEERRFRSCIVNTCVTLKGVLRRWEVLPPLHWQAAATSCNS